MEPKKLSSGLACDQKLPSLSAKYPWFIAQNLRSEYHIIYTINNPQYYYLRRISELHGKRIRACFHGWMILTDHPGRVLWSLWNPLTSKLIRLPPLFHKQGDSHECCLSSPPDHNISVFLLTSIKIPTIVFCRLDRKRKRLKWIEMSYAKQLKSITGVDCFLGCLTCCNGKVYAMASEPYHIDTRVIQVDIMVKGREVVISLLPLVKVPLLFSLYLRCPSYNSFHTIKYFLKGSSTKLFYIVVCFKDEMRVGDVYLFKLDMTSRIWEEITDLKDGILFLELASDHHYCYMSIVDSEIGGYIYILGKMGKIIYSFHVKDRTLSLSYMPGPVRQCHVSSWAMLEYRLEVEQPKSKQDDDKDNKILVRPVKGVELEFGSVTSESHDSRLFNIPFHILKMIMEFCVGVEYMKFRATCKYCYLAAPLIQWSNKKMLKRLKLYSLVSPWLMVLDNHRNIITFIDPTYGDKYFIKTPQELKGDYQIYCSRYGWLLLHRIVGLLVFFNPFTSDVRKLPEVDHYLKSFCFSAPPTSPDCIVVGFTTGTWDVYIHFVYRESSWRRYSLNFGSDYPYSFHFPTFRGRDIYALCNNQRIEAFRDITDDDYTWEEVSNNVPIRSSAEYFLTSCDQHLLLVMVGPFGESIEVFKLNDYMDKWEKIHGLGKHMIYVSNTSCICLEAKSAEMENKIYFPRLLHDEDRKIVFYSLETCRYHTFDNKNIQESFGTDLFKANYLCYPHTWIEPSWWS